SAAAADGRAVRRARRADPHDHGPRALTHLERDPQDRGVRHPQPDRGGLSRRRGAGDVGAAGPHHRPYRDHAAAPAQLRDDGDRRVRAAARPHLATDPKGVMRRTMARPSPARVRWGILLAILLLWEFVPTTGIIPELFLPSLSKTLTVLYQDRHTYFMALLVTLHEVALAMLIACGGGIIVGALVGGLTLLRDLLLPIFSS